MVDLGLALKGVSLAVSVAKYVGIIEDKLLLKVEELAGSELDAGIRALQQAVSSEHERQSLLREARGRFNKAISLESGVRVAAAYVGLALCHINLGDAVNAQEAIRQFTLVKMPEPSTVLQVGRVTSKLSWWHVAAGGPVFAPILAQAKLYGRIADVTLAHHEEAARSLKKLQEEAEELLARSLAEGCDKVFGLAGLERDPSALLPPNPGPQADG